MKRRTSKSKKSKVSPRKSKAHKPYQKRAALGLVGIGAIVLLATLALMGILPGMHSKAFGAVKPASKPYLSHVTNDTAISSRMREIEVPKEKPLDFDRDLAHLAQLESKYRDRLPQHAKRVRVAAPMHRISKVKYRYSGH